MSSKKNQFKRFIGVRPWQRHSLILMIAGSIYIGIGLSYMRTDISPIKAQALHVALSWMDIKHWGVVFVIAGALAIISARWPPISETWGYTVLTGLSAAWASFYGTAVVFDFSMESNFSSALVWFLIAFLWWAISGLVNPTRRLVVNREGPGSSS